MSVLYQTSSSFPYYFTVIKVSIAVLFFSDWWLPVLGCDSSNLRLGACLHVYLERDFLSLETIVYPEDVHHHTHYNSRTNPGTLHSSELSKGWLEGPELEDACKRLHEVLACFEGVLHECPSGKAFFSYRELLHSLDQVHNFLCHPDHRSSRFVEFLRTIECAEAARHDVERHSCGRHNITTNIWNKILRAEVGQEICPALSTQRSCLLEQDHVKKYCKQQSKVNIYAQVSSLFLSTWCKTPVLPTVSHDTSPASSDTAIPTVFCIVINIFLHVCKAITLK